MTHMLREGNGEGGGDDDAVSDGEEKNNAGDALLRDFNYKLLCMVQEGGRNLKARNLDSQLDRLTPLRLF